MVISLVTATLGRVREVQRLLDSLAAQTYKKFELIIVDQNPHTLLQEMVGRYADTINIKYIRSDVKGLSYNRNIGLKHCAGDVVGFPDDDCFYDKEVLESVADMLSNPSYTFVATEMKDPRNDYVWLKRIDSSIVRRDIYKHCLSCNIFVRRNPLVYFDEKLGVGAFWGSGEESDYLWSILEKKDIGVFLKGSYIYHFYDKSFNTHRAYSYGLGFGALFRKEIAYRKHYDYLSLYVYHLLRTIGGLIVKKHRLFYYHTLRGRIKGFLSYRLNQ